MEFGASSGSFEALGEDVSRVVLGFFTRFLVLKMGSSLGFQLLDSSTKGRSEGLHSERFAPSGVRMSG